MAGRVASLCVMALSAQNNTSSIYCKEYQHKTNNRPITKKHKKNQNRGYVVPVKIKKIVNDKNN